MVFSVKGHVLARQPIGITSCREPNFSYKISSGSTSVPKGLSQQLLSVTYWPCFQLLICWWNLNIFHAGCQALIALVLQQGLPNQQPQFIAASDLASLRFVLIRQACLRPVANAASGPGTCILLSSDQAYHGSLKCMTDAAEVNRAPQSASIARSIQDEVNEVLDAEPGYRAATDAEFAELIWAGMSQGGPEVSSTTRQGSFVTTVLSLHTLRGKLKVSLGKAQALTNCAFAAYLQPAHKAWLRKLLGENLGLSLWRRPAHELQWNVGLSMYMLMLLSWHMCQLLNMCV